MASAMPVQPLGRAKDDGQVFEGMPMHEALRSSALGARERERRGDSASHEGSEPFEGFDRRAPDGEKKTLGFVDRRAKPYGSGNGTSLSPENAGLPGAISGAERDQLLVEHLPTVRYLARRIHERLPQHVDLDDLISAGVVGLIDAFSKFDHGKMVQFKSYAQFRIRGAILDSLRTLDWSPRELRRKGRALEEAIRSVTQRVGRAPSEQEVANEMKIPLTEYQTLLGDLKGLEIGSLQMERSEDSGDEELAYIPGAPEDDPLFRCLKGEMKQRLTDAIEELPEKERMVLTLYYYEELTMKEIGLTLGVVESRVSQIHSSAVIRLRAALSALRSTGNVRTSERAKSSRASR